MKNDVWDIVSKPENKSVVSSKWIYKIKHDVDGSKERFVAKGFSHKGELIMKRHMLQEQGTLPSELSWHLLP